MKMLKKNLAVIVLFLLSAVLAFKNYTPGTFLSGWDTLHPEFNFGLNVGREIFGVFRSEQGLGAVAAHSHMADLPRVILLFFADLFLPLSFLRYFYIFLTLIAGPIGMYFFLNKIFQNKTASFLGGVFYSLNLGAMQQFIVPFEMFTTQYATLPFLFLFATNFLTNQENSKKQLLFFTITVLLASPMAFAATLWYIFFFTFAGYLIIFSLFQSPKKQALKKTALLLLVTVLLNLFWILPNIHFVLDNGKNVGNALINQLFSSQAFLYNKEFGNIFDILLLKNFLFDWNVYAGNNNFVPLLSPWISHLQSPLVIAIGFLFAAFAIIGFFISLLKKNAFLIALSFPLLFTLFLLINDNPPTKILYSFLVNNIPLFREALRFPGDKALIIFTFVFSVYFAYGQMLLTKLIKKISLVKLHAVLFLLQSLLFLFLSIYFMLPGFAGNFISPYMRIKIPDSYFEMFKFFEREPPNARIANLPIHSMFGWEYYNWYDTNQNPSVSTPSFQGAGFVSFGVRQPILNRDFDRWNPLNEQYYREMSYAIYTQNASLLKGVLEKYNIKYVLLDKSIITPQSDPKVLLNPQIQNFLSNQTFLQKHKEFGKEIIVYKVLLPTSDENYFIQNPVLTNSETKVSYLDFTYQRFGNYLVSKDSLSSPLANFIDSQNKITPNLLKITENGVLFSSENNQSLDFSSYFQTQSSISAEILVKKDGNVLTITFFPDIPGASSMTALAQLPQDSTDMILNINKTNNFSLTKLADQTPLSLGHVLLNIDSENSIALYQASLAQAIVPDLRKSKYSVEPCGLEVGNQEFGVNWENQNSFSLFGSNNQICMTLPLSEMLGQFAGSSLISLLKVNVAQTTTAVASDFCIAEIQNSLCKSTNLIGIDSADLQNYGIKFFLDVTGSKKVETAFYKDLFLSITQPVFQAEFVKEVVSDALKASGVKKIKLSDFIIPFSGNQELGRDITLVSPGNLSCRNTLNILAEPLSATRSVLEEKNQKFLRYESEEGPLCDHFSYKSLSQDEAYLIFVTSRNIAGLPLSFCVNNGLTKHCDIYANLSNFKDFNTDVFLLLPGIKNTNGYDLNFGSLGIKQTESINDLKSIQIVPFPYLWLTQSAVSAQTPRRIQEAVFVLSKSFDAGWKAYEVKVKIQNSKVKSFLVNLFPFFFGKELKEHVSVNNWANGWLLDNNLTIKQFNNSRIVIIFWPQYLEYVGFVLLIGTFVWLTVSIFIQSSKTLRIS